MLSDEEKQSIESLKNIAIYMGDNYTFSQQGIRNLRENLRIVLPVIEKQAKEIEECKKQLDLDNECEIALNSKVMDLEKEIKELKEERKSYAEEYIYNNPWLYKQLNENYILRVESEQKERKAYIKGTNDAHELCNKKWEDETKAKIEEYEKEIQIRKNVINNDVLDKQTIEKARIEWACMEDFIYEMQSLLEKE